MKTIVKINNTKSGLLESMKKYINMSQIHQQKGRTLKSINLYMRKETS